MYLVRAHFTMIAFQFPSDRHKATPIWTGDRGLRALAMVLFSDVIVRARLAAIGTRIATERTLSFEMVVEVATGYDLCAPT